MTQATDALVRQLLGDLIDPHTGAPLAENVRAVGVDGARVSVDIQLGYPAVTAIDGLAARVRQALEADPAIEAAAVSITSRIHVHKVQGTLGPLPNVKNIIVVASGKGGVGKSTVSANLALALQAEGAKVGVMDADIYGPSQPTMLGVHGKPASPDGKSIIPMQAHGMPVMSIGFLVEEDTPMIWRGPMVTQAMMQLITDTRWEQLDYLIIDLPPGTGDIQLTLSQKVPVAGAIIVTTPQDIALLDARKALKMFEKVEVPVLGVVENMATHVCSNCGHEENIFGEGGGERMATQYGAAYLGSLPLDIRIREQADGGNPTVVAMPESDLAARYREIARNAAGRLSRQPRNKSLGLGKIVVQGAPGGMKVVAQVLCLSGSLRRVSSNSAALEAAYRLAPSTLELLLYKGLGELPLFNPDAETDPLPPAVAELREAVDSADALLIACPEYAHGVPGAFKNLLDWLVGSPDFPGKPVLLLNTAARGSYHAQEALAEILSTMSAQLLAAQPVTVALPGAGSSVAQVLESADRCAELQVALRVLVEALAVD